MLEQWIRIWSETPGNEKAYAQFLALMAQQQLLASDASAERFFRIATELCVEACLKSARPDGDDAAAAEKDGGGGDGAGGDGAGGEKDKKDGGADGGAGDGEGAGGGEGGGGGAAGAGPAARARRARAAAAAAARRRSRTRSSTRTPSCSSCSSSTPTRRGSSRRVEPKPGDESGADDAAARAIETRVGVLQRVLFAVVRVLVADHEASRRGGEPFER